MKKTYIIPTAKSIVFSTEENVLASGSFRMNDRTGDIEGGMSNERETTSSSIWGED